MLRSFLSALLFFLEILREIFAQILKLQSKKTSKEYQDEANKAKADIVSAFNSHFGSVSDSKTSSGAKTDSNKA